MSAGLGKFPTYGHGKDDEKHSNRDRRKRKSESKGSQFGTLSAHPHPQRIDSSDWPFEIGKELRTHCENDENLRKSVVNALNELEGRVESDNVRVFIEHDRENPMKTKPVIEVRDEFDSIDEYKHLKSKVREVVRNSETNGIMIYTRVKRE